MSDDREWLEGWSAWRVWRHPVKALDVIDESALIIMDLDKKHKEDKHTLAERADLYEKLSEERDSLLTTLSERERELGEVRLELSEALEALNDVREELALHRSVDEKLEEFNRQLTKAENMKLRYEKRISDLEKLLRRQTPSSAAEEDELALEQTKSDVCEKERFVIDMTRREEPATPERVENDKVDNHATELQRRFREKPIEGLPENVLPDKKLSSDNWLLDLPDNL